MKFLLNIDPFLLPLARGTEVTVTHNCGKPYEVSLPPALVPYITDSIQLVEYIEAAAKNNWESMREQTPTLSRQNIAV